MGRLYLALTLVDPRLVYPDNAEDAAELPSLVQMAWQAGGYHLRLKALDAVVRAGRRLDDQTRARLVEVLESFDVSSNINLSSVLVDALAACDAIEPMRTLDQIRGEIETVLAQPDSPDAWTLASGIYYRQFENNDIVGPYSEAVAELDDQRTLQLCVMAARAGPRAWQPGWVIREIADRAELIDEAGREVLREAATTSILGTWATAAAERAVAGQGGQPALRGELAQHLAHGAVADLVLSRECADRGYPLARCPLTRLQPGPQQPGHPVTGVLGLVLFRRLHDLILAVLPALVGSERAGHPERNDPGLRGAQ